MSEDHEGVPTQPRTRLHCMMAMWLPGSLNIGIWRNPWSGSWYWQHASQTALSFSYPGPNHVLWWNMANIVRNKGIHTIFPQSIFILNITNFTWSFKGIIRRGRNITLWNTFGTNLWAFLDGIVPPNCSSRMCSSGNAAYYDPHLPGGKGSQYWQWTKCRIDVEHVKQGRSKDGQCFTRPYTTFLFHF